MVEDDWWELDVDATMAIAEGFCPDCRVVLVPAPDSLLSGGRERKDEIHVFGHCYLCDHLFLISDGTFTMSHEVFAGQTQFPTVPLAGDAPSSLRRQQEFL